MFLAPLCSDGRQINRGDFGGEEPEENGRRRSFRLVIKSHTKDDCVSEIMHFCTSLLIIFQERSLVCHMEGEFGVYIKARVLCRSLREDCVDTKREADQEEEDQHQKVHSESLLQWIFHVRSALWTNTGAWCRNFTRSMQLHRFSTNCVCQWWFFTEKLIGARKSKSRLYTDSSRSNSQSVKFK